MSSLDIVVGEVSRSEAIFHACGHQWPGGMSSCANHARFDCSISSAIFGHKTFFVLTVILFPSQNTLMVAAWIRIRADKVLRDVELQAPSIGGPLAGSRLGASFVTLLFCSLEDGRVFVRFALTSFFTYGTRKSFQTVISACHIMER